MSFQAMPFLFLNMGGEMAYILEQRLQAQNVEDEKAYKVLGEIMETMFDESFLRELFRPQATYSRSALRQLFEQIAHSSVMRLNGQSMDKLFDLMLMAFKYQTMLCKEPSELVLVTANHLEGIKQIFKEHPKVTQKIEQAGTLLMDSFGEMPLWKMASIRSELMAFMLGARVKMLFSPGEQIELPYNAVVPGSIRYTDPSLGAILRTEPFPTCDQQFKVVPNQDRTMSRGTTLGQNMYKAEQVGQVSVAQLPTATETDTLKAREEQQNPPLVVAPQGSELVLLSMLLQRKAVAGKTADFDLSLFDEDGNEAEAEQAPQIEAKTGLSGKAQVLAREKTLSKAVDELALKELEQKDATAEKAPGSKGRNLLAMMDEASAPPPPAKLPARKNSAAKKAK